MAINLTDPKEKFSDIKRHIGHRISVVAYGLARNPANVAIECDTCGEVLVDEDNA